MRISGFNVLLFVGVIASFAIIAYVVYIFSFGELGEKRAWTVLQGIEFKARHETDIRDPVVLDNAASSGYTILGIPTDSANFPRVWIILNEITPSSSVYVIPQGQPFLLHCSFVEELQSTTKIKPQVLDFLKRHCMS